jgi:hypothetical protein
MTPQNQEIVARNQISILLADGHGDPAYVAVAWYSGEDTAKAFQADPTNPKWKVPIGKYPSIAGYAQSVVGKMASQIPGTLATQSMVGQVGNLSADGSGPPLPGAPWIGPPSKAGTTPWTGQPDPAGSLAHAAAGGVADVAAGTSTGIGGAYAGGAVGGAMGGIPTATPIVDQPTGQAGQVPSGTVTGGQPTPAQLLPTSTGIYTQVNPSADIAELLRQNNPQGAGAHDLAQVLDAVRQLFHG